MYYSTTSPFTRLLGCVVIGLVLLTQMDCSLRRTQGRQQFTPSGDPGTTATTAHDDGNHAAATTSNGDALPSLPGTDWHLSAWRTTDGTIKKCTWGCQSLEFIGTKWSLMHSAGRVEAGTYKLQGKRLVMKYEDGSAYGDFTVSWNAPTQEMTWTSGDLLMRFKLEPKNK